ncbi:MAG TPA: hypothetical protein VIL35_13615 [Vicinamibacterales bacterium]
MRERGDDRIDARLDAALRALTQIEPERVARSTQRTLLALRETGTARGADDRFGWWGLAAAGVLSACVLGVLLFVMRTTPDAVPAPLASRPLVAVATPLPAPASGEGLLRPARLMPQPESRVVARGPDRRGLERDRPREGSVPAPREDPLPRLVAAIQQLPEELWERPANPFPPLRELEIEEMALPPLQTPPLPDMASGSASDTFPGGSE